MKRNNTSQHPEVLFVTSYPPRECGIATYSQDLINAIEKKFGDSFSIKVCALETKDETFNYENRVVSTLNTSISEEYGQLAKKINSNAELKIVVFQHEFGFYNESGGKDFSLLLKQISKPKIIAFHTVLPCPDKVFKDLVCDISNSCQSIIVMTNASKNILVTDYGISADKIEVIAHGTHLVSNDNKLMLKDKFGFKGHKILSTFGLISSGKGIETTLDALPSIVKTNPTTLFLIIGKTHPGVIKHEGEKYRNMLEEKVKALHLEKHVKFINKYLDLPELLEYLRLTDIYLFTSKDPNQAVSGTFSYAMSCGCPVISTPIPQAKEMIDDNTGIIIDFQDSKQLTAGVVKLLSDEPLQRKLSINTLQKIAPTAWENSAIAHGVLFERIIDHDFTFHYNTPEINLNHLKEMTTDFGLIQFSRINQPDLESGYTLDDNARALIAVCMHYEFARENHDLGLMYKYLDFINFCLQPDGTLLNYVDKDKKFTIQNNETNLEDSNGRAIWALGFLLSQSNIIPLEMSSLAKKIIDKAILNSENIFSTRAMAFTIKGLYFYNLAFPRAKTVKLIDLLANRIELMYEHESEKNWEWYESYLTYANAILPEAMYLSSLAVEKPLYAEIAKKSFDFLISHTFHDDEIKVISNRGWLSKGGERKDFGEQPIDISYTIMALYTFHRQYKDEHYMSKLNVAFNWFLGKNHLRQIIYNPCTGGCYDGLEEFQVNLNQGAESTVSYLMARMIVEKYRIS
ncbi:MAG: glycosyltransferase [Bacteroidota bacterium]